MRLIFLHGGAAAGKLTTARALADSLHYPVFHNHLVVDLLTEVFPFGSAEFVRLREQFWLGVFEAAAVSGRSLIFTFAPESTVVHGFPGRVEATVRAGGGVVQFVRLVVSAGEQDRRIGNPDRREFHKLADPEVLRRLRQTAAQVEQPPADLEIDTDRSSPQESSRTIIDHFRLTPERGHERYPPV